MKTSSMLNILLTLIAASVALSNAGQIWSRDIKIVPNNKESEGMFYFYFSLDTSISSTDYLRFVLPFGLNETTPEAYWDVYIDCDDAGSTKKAIVEASTVSGDEANAFFVRFASDMTGTLYSSLVNNQYYYLKFKATPVASNDERITTPVKMYTVSRNDQNSWITYDYNTAFGLIYLARKYSSSMLVSITISESQSNYQQLGGTYPTRFDFTPSSEISNGALIYLTLTDQRFTITDCSSVQNTTQGFYRFSKISFESKNTYTIVATVDEAVKTQKYRFSCSVTNAGVTASSTASVTIWHRYQTTIVQAGSSTGTKLQGLPNPQNTYTWDETQHKVELGWGYDASNPNALPVFALYKDASTNERWYQSSKIYFEPSVDVPADERLEVVVWTLNDAGMTVLSNTILHNLPDYSAEQKVTCRAVTQFLICSNVGSLSARGYFISFKFSLAVTVAATNAPNFGKVKLQTVANSVEYISFSTITLTNSRVRQNPLLFHSTRGAKIAYTEVAGPADTEYIHAGSQATLKLGFKYFKDTIIPLNTDDANKGLEFYTSPALPSSTSPTCSIDTLVQDTDISITDCSVTSLSKFTRLRFRIAKLLDASGNAASLFTGSFVDGTVRFASVTFDDTKLTSMNYVNEHVYDFYARWVDGFTSPTPAITTNVNSSPFFFNSLVYSTDALFYLNAGLSFFITGAGTDDAANDGARFPTLLRISGKVTSTEASQAEHIVIFFNDLEPIDTSNICFGPEGTVCSYNAGELPTTQTDDLVDYSGSSRLVITTSLATEINVYIPVKTVPGKKKIGFLMAAAMTIDESATAQNIFQTTFSRRFSSTDYTKTNTGSSLSIDTFVDGTTPKINVPAGTVLGSSATTTLTDLTIAYIATTPNTEGTLGVTAGKNGAGYGICADYDFTSADNFAFERYPESTTTAASQCRTLKYNSASNTEPNVFCQVCPVHTAMTAGTDADLAAFTFPMEYGIDLGKLVYFSSDNDGNLKKATEIQESAKLTETALSTRELTFFPEKFKKESQNHYTSLKFTTVTTLSGLIQVSITPNGGSDLYFDPVSVAGCKCSTNQVTSCAVTGSGATAIAIIIDSMSGQWPAGEHEVIFYVDGTNSGLSSDTVVNFDVTIKTIGIAGPGNFVNHHLTGDTSDTFTVLNEAQKVIKLSEFSYLFANQGFKTKAQFTFELPDDMAVAAGQKIKIDLGNIADTNTGYAPTCYLVNRATNLISTAFLSCDTSDLADVIVQTKSETTGSYIIVIPFITAANTNTGAITVKVRNFDDSASIVENDLGSTFTPSATTAGISFATGTLGFNRLYENPGNVGEYSFTLMSSATDIGPSSSIYIYFPAYYSPRLGSSQLYCTANDRVVGCFLRDNHLMKVAGFSTTIQKGTSVSIQVYGILVPAVTRTNLERFYIAVDTDGDLSSLVQQGSVADTAPTAAATPALIVSAFKISNNVIRVDSTRSITFSTDNKGISQSKYLIVDFPSAYRDLLQSGVSLSMTIAKTNSSSIVTLQTTVFGSRLRTQLPVGLDPVTSYTLTIGPIENIEIPDCDLNRVSIQVVGIDQRVADYRSAPQAWNAPANEFIEDSGVATLYIENTVGIRINSLVVTAGTYSAPIRVKSGNGDRLRNDMVLAASGQQFDTLPSPVNVFAGTLYSELRIAGASGTQPNVYSLTIAKTEVTSYDLYSDLPLLTVVLTDEPKTIPNPNIEIAVGGTSLPYVFNMEAIDAIPYDDLSITATVASGSSLAIKDDLASVVLTPTKTKKSLLFTLSSSATVGDTVTFDLELSAANAAAYKLERSTVTVTAVAAPTQAPTISNLVFSVNFAATKQRFVLESDQIATLYWHVAYTGKVVTTDCQEIKDAVQADYKYNRSDSNQAQYGVVYVTSTDMAAAGLIENLYAATSYSLVGCAENQMGQFSTATTGDFTTKDLGITDYKLTLSFNQDLTKSHIKVLCCLFLQELNLPNSQ